jgi:hypothetical protein
MLLFAPRRSYQLRAGDFVVATHLVPPRSGTSPGGMPSLHNLALPCVSVRSVCSALGCGCSSSAPPRASPRCVLWHSMQVAPTSHPRAYLMRVGTAPRLALRSSLFALRSFALRSSALRSSQLRSSQLRSSLFALRTSLFALRSLALRNSARCSSLFALRSSQLRSPLSAAAISIRARVRLGWMWRLTPHDSHPRSLPNDERASGWRSCEQRAIVRDEEPRIGRTSPQLV